VRFSAARHHDSMLLLFQEILRRPTAIGVMLLVAAITFVYVWMPQLKRRRQSQRPFADIPYVAPNPHWLTGHLPLLGQRRHSRRTAATVLRRRGWAGTCMHLLDVWNARLYRTRCRELSDAYSNLPANDATIQRFNDTLCAHVGPALHCNDEWEGMEGESRYFTEILSFQ
jgi:hypothetical protein